jgi:hypothetical protein
MYAFHMSNIVYIPVQDLGIHSSVQWLNFLNFLKFQMRSRKLN